MTCICSAFIKFACCSIFKSVMDSYIDEFSRTQFYIEMNYLQYTGDSLRTVPTLTARFHSSEELFVCGNS